MCLSFLVTEKSERVKAFILFAQQAPSLNTESSDTPILVTSVKGGKGRE